jgi:dephospho-CoA kinase
VEEIPRISPGSQPALLDTAQFGVILTDDAQRQPAQGGKVFRLEAIVHPAVEALVMQRLADLPAEAVAVVDAVKLLEGSLGHRCDAVWLVVCPVGRHGDRPRRCEGSLAKAGFVLGARR